MKRKMLIAFLIFSVWSCASYVYSAGGPYNIIVAWEMSFTTDLDGYEMRINEDNETIVDIVGGSTSWSTTRMLRDGNNTFELRAIDLSGQKSLWSDPGIFNPPPTKPILTIIILK
jgi:hypothetical protein